MSGFFSGIGSDLFKLFISFLKRFITIHDRGTRPCKVYGGRMNPDDNLLFQNLLDSVKCCSFYYYEGIDITRCSEVIYAFCAEHPNGKKKILHIHLGLSHSDAIPTITKSLERLVDCIDVFAVTVFISKYPVQMHLHLTDDKVFFSPYIRTDRYPTTYCYKKIKDKDNDHDNSFYHNLLLYYSQFQYFKKVSLCDKDSISTIINAIHRYRIIK